MFCSSLVMSQCTTFIKGCVMLDCDVRFYLSLYNNELCFSNCNIKLCLAHCNLGLCSSHCDVYERLLDCVTIQCLSRVMFDCEIHQGIMFDICHIKMFVKGYVSWWCSSRVMLECYVPRWFHCIVILIFVVICLIATFIRGFDTLQIYLRVMFQWNVPEWSWCSVIFILVDL